MKPILVPKGEPARLQEESRAQIEESRAVTAKRRELHLERQQLQSELTDVVRRSRELRQDLLQQHVGLKAEFVLKALRSAGFVVIPWYGGPFPIVTAPAEAIQ